MNDRRGQTIITVAFVVGVGLLLWVFLAPTISYWGHQWALQADGLEALLADNLNAFIGFGLLAYAAIGIYITGGGA